MSHLGYTLEVELDISTLTGKDSTPQTNQKCQQEMLTKDQKIQPLG